MPRRKCFEIPATEIAFGIGLYQLGVDRFEVVYGKQIHTDLTYGQGCDKLGQAIFHALACDGKLDNRERGERR